LPTGCSQLAGLFKSFLQTVSIPSVAVAALFKSFLQTESIPTDAVAGRLSDLVSIRLSNDMFKGHRVNV
jgi:hypothetical protein